MSRMFLASSFSDVANIFGKIMGKNIEGKSVTFIPTASIPEKVTFYVKSGRKSLEKLGLIIDELDISTATTDEIRNKLQTNDFIYVTGGNTFFLLQELKKTGADELIKNQVFSGKLYIGESAGSIILSPNIEYVKDMDDCNKAPLLSKFDSLNVVSFYPLPHCTNFPFKKATEKIILEYSKRLELYPISNAQAIVIDGDNIEIVSK